MNFGHISSNLRRALVLVLTSLSAVALNSCGGLADSYLSNGTFGLVVYKVTGDNQLIFPSAISRTMTIQLVSTDGLDNVANVTVKFEEITNLGAVILTPSIETNSLGYASTQIRMPPGTGALVQIKASVEGTQLATIFNLTVNQNQPGVHYALDTLNGGVETAGVPFNFIVKIVGDDGTVDTTVNDTQVLRWTFEAVNSWGGNAPVLPAAVQACTFTGGVCIVNPVSTLMDTLNTTRVYVGDGPSGLIDVFAQTVTLNKNVASKLVFADKAGGPAMGAVVTSNSTTISVNADSPAQSYFGAITDVAGNYWQDTTSGTWSATNEKRFDLSAFPLISSHLSTTSGPTTTFTPTETGTGDLSLSFGAYPTLTKAIVVEPGAPNTVNVVTEHGGAESAGVPFLIDVKVTDAKGNSVVRSDGSSALNGAYDLDYFWDAVVDGIPTGSVIGTQTLVGCTGFTGMSFPAGTYPAPNQVQCNNMSSNSAPFINGALQAGGMSSGIIRDAIGVTPVMTVKLKLSSVPLTYIRGSTPVSVTTGAPAITTLFKTPNDPDSSVCNQYNWGLGNGWLPASTTCGEWTTTPQINRTAGAAPTTNVPLAGDAPLDYYLAVLDTGGNFLYHTTTTGVSWGSTPAAWVPDWSWATVMVGGIPTSKFTLTPVHAGAQMSIAIGAAGLATSMSGAVYAGPVTRWSVEASDALNTVPSSSRTQYLMFKAYDAIGNQTLRYMGASYPLSTGVTMEVNYAGAVASPLGTPAVVPAASPAVATYGLVANSTCNCYLVGDAINRPFRTPNSNSQVTISATDITVPASPIVATPYVFYPTAGTPLSLQLRDAPNGGGNNVTAGTHTITTDAQTYLYATAYDAEQNYMNLTPTWNLGTLTANATVTPFANYLTIDANSVSSNAITATLGALTVGTTVQINAGNLATIGLATTNGGIETAGTSFDLTITLRDTKGNLKTDINGAVLSNISVQNSNATVYGYNKTGLTGTQNLNFTAGVITTPIPYTFYNSADAAQFVVTLLGRSGNLNLLLNPQPFDHVRIKRNGSGNYYAGDPLILDVGASDIYGNNYTTGAGTGSLTFAFGSALGGQDITATTLSGATGVGGAADGSVTGNLVAGAAQITTTATQSGTLTFTGAISGYPNNPTPPIAALDSVTVLPRPTINSIDFDPSAPPPTLYTASASTSMDPFRVRLKDVYGNVITTDSSTNISLSLIGATKSLTGTTSLQASLGASLFLGLKYAKAESFTLRATESTSSKTVDAAITVQAGPASQAIVILPGQSYSPGETSPALAISGAPSAQTACSSFSVTVRAVDDGYNTVTSYNNTVGLLSTDAKAVLPASTNFTAGVASFTFTNRLAGNQGLTPNTGLGTNTASATYLTNTGSASQVLLVLPGQTHVPGAANLASAITGAVTAQTAGTAFNVDAKAVDNCFNVVNDSSTSVSLANFGASFTGFTAGSYPGSGNVNWDGAKTLAAGLATFSTNYYNTTTGRTITPSNTGGLANQASGTLVVNNAAADHLAFQAYPAASTFNAGASLGVIVRVEDVYNNVCTTGTDATATIQLVRTGGNNLISNGSTVNTAANISKAAVAGVADFTAGTIATVQDTSTGNRINASKTTGGALSLNGPNLFDIQAAALAKYAVSGVPASLTAGDVVAALQVIAQDAYSNTKLNSVDTVTFTSNDAQAVLPANYTFLAGDNGVHTFNNAVTLKTAGTGVGMYVAASKSGAPAITGQQNGYTVNAAAADRLVITGTGSVNAAACSSTLTMNSRDQYGNNSNLAGGTTVTISGAAGGAASDLYVTGCGSLLGGSAGARTVSIAPGTSSTTFAFRGTTKQTVNLTGSDGSLTNAGFSLIVSYDPTTLSMSKTAGDGQTGTVGTALGTALQVQIVDSYGNGANGRTVTFGSGSGTATPASPSTDANGFASSTWTLGTVSGAQTKNASSTGVTTQIFNATATPAAANKLAFTTAPVANSIKGQNFQTMPVVQVRDTYNNLIPGATDTITLSPYIAAACTVGWGTIANNAVAAVSGVATFANVSYTHGGTNLVGLYIQATAPGLTAACAPITTVYDTPALSPAAPSLATGAAQTFTVNSGGGVPPIGIAVTTNGSQTSTTSCSNCGGTGLNYTAGPFGGGSSDVITLTDARGNTTTATVTVTGARIGWTDGATYNYGTVAADTPHAFPLGNTGTATTGAHTITMTNCKRGVTTIACTDMWDIASGANCQGNTVAAAGSCSVTATFRASSGVGAVAGTYTADLNATASGGGSLIKISLTAVK